MRVDDGRISIPRGSAPSSHILKPVIDTWEGIVFNEAFCMKLARACDLNTANVEIGKVEDIDYLLVERYDRVRNEAEEEVSVEAGAIRRVHQEDFCQALIMPRHVVTFAVSAGLGAVQTRARVATLTEKVLGKIAYVPKPEPISEAVAALIAERCEKFLRIFRKD